VRVNGQPATVGLQVADSDRIDVDRRARGQQAAQVTILINKPIGYVSGQAEDGHEPAIALVDARTQWPGDTSGRRFQPAHRKGLAPAGRLDIDSMGLLVLTQDGRVARRLIGEESQMEKEYLVRVSLDGLGTGVQARFPHAQLARLRHGLTLDGEALQPAQVQWQNPEQLRFVLTKARSASFGGCANSSVSRWSASSGYASATSCSATCRWDSGATCGRTSSSRWNRGGRGRRAGDACAQSAAKQ
jgi:23S rRNA pseudouridine2604 synthase